jgi:hypothetical protein
MRRTDLATDIASIVNVSSQSALINRAIQRALDKMSGYTKWPFLMDTGHFTTFDDISAGDADVTNASRSVTSNNGSTSWDASVVQRKFRAAGETAFYRINSRASLTSITLEAPYQGTTATDGTYSIYQDEYLLNADVDMNHLARQIQTGRSLTELDTLDFDDLYPAPRTTGDPYYLIPIGRSRQGLVYSTGIVTASVGGTTIAGTSTAWLGEGAQGVSKGSRIRIGSDVYTIKSVDSDTQVTIYGTITTAVTSTTYEIFLDNIVAQIYPIPDAARNIYYRYWRKPAPMENNWDEPDMPSNWQWLLIPGALMELWAHKGDEVRVRGAEKEFYEGLQRMKQELIPSVRTYHKKSQTAYQAHRGPRWPDNFDVRANAF